MKKREIKVAPGIEFGIWTHEKKDAYISTSILRAGIWEPLETQLVLSLLKPGDVFVDVGANIGWFTLIAASRVGRAGRVYSFEPEGENFQILARNIAVNRFSNVCCIRAALSDKNETRSLYTSKENLGDHRLFDDGLEARESVEVDCIDASSFFEKTPFSISMIKSDTQGFEGKVFAGFSKLFQDTGEKPFILVEFWPRGLLVAGDDPVYFLKFFREFGYSIYILDSASGSLKKIDPINDQALTDKLAGSSDLEAHVNLLIVPGNGTLLVI